ncbi:MAG TPA: trypsin-like peptidase domain-containing protein [Gemmataceae bacterium]|nr:trypsin-like peptidase domain-containing protein [Gemmataceae bacterium]
MRTHLSLLAALLLAAPLSAQPILTGPAPAAYAAGSPARDWNPRMTPVVEVVKRCRNAVVNIHSERSARNDFSDDSSTLSTSQNHVNGMGTGIVIDPRGYIITNQHVVDEVSALHVRLADGTSLPARVVARDREADLALLKVDAGYPLSVVPLGTASDLMVGETVVAIGNAYGYEHTVSVGVVSAVGRDVALNKDVSYKALIQTDASINPGNSGGPLLNVNGDLIGVNVAIRAGAQGIGFAIPVDAVIKSAAAMMDSHLDGAGAAQAAQAAQLGLAVKDDVQTGRSDGGFTRSVVVDRVDAGGPAAKAGLQRGDVVTRAGDTAVGSSLDLQRGFLEHIAGDHIALTIRRNGAEQQTELVLEATHTAVAASTPSGDDLIWRKLGLRLRSVSADSVNHDNPQLQGGLLVTDVRPDGPALDAGVHKGDVLIGLHQFAMTTPDNVLYVLNLPELASLNPLRFYILRNGQVHKGTLAAAD